MGSNSNFELNSYVKTSLACLMLLLMALLFAYLGTHWLPRVSRAVVAVLSLLVGVGSAVFACAGLLVHVRYKRSTRGKQDLFLYLNRSREPAAINAAVVARIGRWRRNLAQRLLGHDLVAGDMVEIKTWAEIHATLDQRGCFEQLPFMPEMLAMCGQRARVFRCMHRLFDYRKTRRMRHMNGAVLLVGSACSGLNHGGCEAACYTIWKAAWLRKVERNVEATDAALSSIRTDPVTDVRILQFGTQGPHYECQLTQLNAASRPIGGWSVNNFLRPLVSRNVAPQAFAVGWLTHLFNVLQQRRGGVGFPAFESVLPNAERSSGEIQWALGDHVIVKSSAEIRATLNDRLMNRGLYFEPDMLKYCGRQLCVQAEVRRLIDIVSGEMRTMKTPAYILRDIRFSGERQQFNSQHEPLFWRDAWLRRDANAN